MICNNSGIVLHFAALPMKRRVVIGIDGYNQSISGDVAMTVTCSASDCHHVPLVVVRKVGNGEVGIEGSSEKEGDGQQLALFPLEATTLRKRG